MGQVRDAGWAVGPLVFCMIVGSGCSTGSDGNGIPGGTGGSGTGGTAGTGGTGGTAGTGGTGGTAGTGQAGTSGSAGAGGTTLPPFDCDLPTPSPTLAPEVRMHPTQPNAGEALTLVIWSSNTQPSDAPVLVGEITNRDGTRQVTDYTMVGGAQATFYMTFAGLAEGANCIVMRDESHVQVAHKIHAPSPGAGIPRGNGVWKVRSNHQWRCDEQPTFGNLLHVRVIDEESQPIEDAVVNIRWTDDTVFPVKPDEDAMNWSDHAHPKQLTTGPDGRAELFTPWGEGVRTPVDGKPKLLVFLLSVVGGASDTATEITTGLWETDASGCNYCSTYAVNVYGHWSHTVEFQRDPTASEVCEVPVDHAGQQGCSHTHFFHDRDIPSCLPVANP